MPNAYVWNNNTKTKELIELPEGSAVYRPNGYDTIGCAKCGKSILYKHSEESLAIKDNQENGWRICRGCARAEGQNITPTTHVHARELQVVSVKYCPPYTTVCFEDGDEVTVFANEPFDREKGLAMAVLRKLYTRSLINRLSSPSPRLGDEVVVQHAVGSLTAYLGMVGVVVRLEGSRAFLRIGGVDLRIGFDVSWLL